MTLIIKSICLVYHCVMSWYTSNMCIQRPSRGFCKRTYSSRVTVNFLWGGNRPPVRRGLSEWSIFPPTDEKVNRLYPHPQLGLSFPLLLTCTSDGRLLQESRWRRTNMNAGLWKARACLRSGAVCSAPLCLPACEERLEKSSARRGPA